jgi:PAS domain S-box-containing protein
MERIIQAMSDGVAVVNHQGSIVMVNRAMCDIVGYRADEMLEKGWAELFFIDPANQDFNQTIVEVVQTHEPVTNREVGYRTPSGGAKELLATTSLIVEDGRTLGLVALFKDVTELNRVHHRQRELMARSRRLYEEKRESLDRVARAVAHEVRNPVTAIGGLASRLLRKTDPESNTAQYLTRILDSTSRLEEIVAQVRAYAFVPRPQLRLVDLGPWLDALLEPYARQAAEAGVKLQLAGIRGQKVKAMIDPELLGAALNNMLVNSLEAMPEGGSLAVELAGTPEDAIITISDTGKGISPQDLPYLFDPFFTTKADRVGMSLAITERIVAEHGGALEADSQPGRGTRIMIAIPLGAEPEETVLRQPQLK